MSDIDTELAEEAKNLTAAIIDLVNDRPATIQALAIAGAVATVALNSDSPSKALDLIIEIVRAIVAECHLSG